MSRPQALLALARKLLRLKAKKFGDTQMRRAVSTAYYALFHLLIDAAAGVFVSRGSTYAQPLRREFDHEPMKIASGQVRNGNLPKLFGLPGSFRLPEQLKQVAKTFVDLQVERETADYDHSGSLSPEKVEELLTRTEEAFAAWETVKETDEARLYLASFLLRSAWNKDPRGAPAKRPDNTDGNPT